MELETTSADELEKYIPSTGPNGTNLDVDQEEEENADYHDTPPAYFCWNCCCPLALVYREVQVAK